MTYIRTVVVLVLFVADTFACDGGHADLPPARSTWTPDTVAFQPPTCCGVSSAFYLHTPTFHAHAYVLMQAPRTRFFLPKEGSTRREQLWMRSIMIAGRSTLNKTPAHRFRPGGLRLPTAFARNFTILCCRGCVLFACGRFVADTT